ncbi:MAG: hypothetical protein ACRETB_13535 [Steroidobacteraceae bacterium]
MTPRTATVPQARTAPPAAETQAHEAARRKRVRRTAIIFGCIAAAFYFGFIVMAVVKAELGDGHRAPEAPPPAALR